MTNQTNEQSQPHPLSQEMLEQQGFEVVAANCPLDNIQVIYVADPNHTVNNTESFSNLIQSIWRNDSVVLVEGRDDDPGNGLTIPDGEPASWENEFVYKAPPTINPSTLGRSLPY